MIWGERMSQNGDFRSKIWKESRFTGMELSTKWPGCPDRAGAALCV